MKAKKKKIGFKITGIVLGAIIFLFLAIALINKICEVRLNSYIDSFSPIEYSPDRLTPELDEDAVWTFTSDREFKVVQLTDVHLGGGLLSFSEDKKTINAIAAMLSEEKPDLVIVTGDVSFAVPYISGTLNNAYAHRIFKRTMERLGAYWTLTFGNHDSEAYNYYGREKVAKMYTDGMDYCLFSSDGSLSGEGNHVINVKNSKGFISESFYMIDTHSYTDDDPLGLKWDYDYVKEDQISWYRETVEKYKAHNSVLYSGLTDSEKPLYEELLNPKSLMFMHIPLREVKYAYEEYVNNNRQNTENTEYIRGHDGEVGEIIYCSRTDEQLFETVLELGSTQALFYGHDHLNNFVLNYKGITLSYGYSLDYLAYSDIDNMGYQRGCTVITCAPNGNAVITHENYYQEKYVSLYDKEEVDMTPSRAEE